MARAEQGRRESGTSLSDLNTSNDRLCKCAKTAIAGLQWMIKTPSVGEELYSYRRRLNKSHPNLPPRCLHMVSTVTVDLVPAARGRLVISLA